MFRVATFLASFRDLLTDLNIDSFDRPIGKGLDAVSPGIAHAPALAVDRSICGLRRFLSVRNDL
jgi:hypothetical protein